MQELYICANRTCFPLFTFSEKLKLWFLFKSCALCFPCFLPALFELWLHILILGQGNGWRYGHEISFMFIAKIYQECVATWQVGGEELLVCDIKPLPLLLLRQPLRNRSSSFPSVRLVYWGSSRSHHFTPPITTKLKPSRERIPCWNIAKMKYI